MTTDDENGISSELLGRLEAAAAGAGDEHSIAERLRVTDEERRSVPGHLQAAFEYAEAPPGPEPVGVGSFFGPMMEFGDQRYPPALEALPEEMGATWQAAADVVTAPLAAARAQRPLLRSWTRRSRHPGTKGDRDLPRGRAGTGEWFGRGVG